MKFLIFNIIVFFSLGYLLTSKPNENFNEWVGNTKNKITQISKKEIISTIKKATSNNEDKEISIKLQNKKNDLIKTNQKLISNNNVQENSENSENDKVVIVKTNERAKKIISVNNESENGKKLEIKKTDIAEKNHSSNNQISDNTKNIKVNDKKFDVQQIINDVIAAKKANQLKNKTVVKDNNKIITNKREAEQEKDYQEENKFMTNLERENALAELIIDMELYHLNNLKD